MVDGFGRGKARLGCLLALIVVAPTTHAIPPPVEQFSAVCTAPSYASDQLVCSDPALLKLDHQIADLLGKQERMASPPTSEYFESQADWFRRRSRCAFSVAHRQCLIEAYQDRLKVLSPLHEEPRKENRSLICDSSTGIAEAAAISNSDGYLTLIGKGRILAVASPETDGAIWRPFVGWKMKNQRVKLTLLSGTKIICRVTVSKN